ncbi:16S rRNA (guanine(966)-N(2))-methyltransferase RsmD [Pseudoalteromonas aurantia]|uniref:Ribosomal RNA small subunit methyltransferase D n=2 Tax=Pseudoalteromonas TaxID=53246 RepID=A0A5S3VBK1_9GAMM|nr:16S rRNA (guanine(966)-N(2))-methyltransferase RsmD [Pseudoalteromonas aurantia]TMO69400.1 16S rRNA (guanine(966)-N(2))-methyltransferase RsmD [Pseudoalteromonas aurantia]TMO77964.1 16S rRNA (guanine(966)-N(2))-methyltransferase RsmD [Pseudoalteromonas aurantia]
MRKKAPVKKVSTDGFIRIISGKFKSRKLPVKDVEGLRPTTDRIKETVFNWLMQDTRNAKVLDCFAGSGGLGFEALSRFAAHTDFIELDKLAATQLQKNITTLKLNNAHVINDNALAFLQKNNSATPYSLVFVDPPFRKGLAQPCCEALEAQNWLTSDALIYVEVEKELAFSAPQTWQVIKEKQAGQVLCQLYQRSPLSHQ